MFAYDTLLRYPDAFRGLTGMAPGAFEDLLTAFRAAQDRRRRRRRTTRQGQPRQRAAGAGPPHRHDDRHRLLMALVWLRVYPTYELLGLFFGLHKRNAQLNVRDVLATLDTLDDFPFGRPGRERTKVRSVAAVMAAFPQVRVIIDSKEQRVNRPRGYEAQKPYYSGKKKAHTLKTQVVVDPCGRIEAVSDSVPGGANHDLPLLRGSGVLEPGHSRWDHRWFRTLVLVCRPSFASSSSRAVERCGLTSLMRLGFCLVGLRGGAFRIFARLILLAQARR